MTAASSAMSSRRASSSSSRDSCSCAGCARLAQGAVGVEQLGEGGRAGQGALGLRAEAGRRPVVVDLDAGGRQVELRQEGGAGLRHLLLAGRHRQPPRRQVQVGLDRQVHRALQRQRRQLGGLGVEQAGLDQGVPAGRHADGPRGGHVDGQLVARREVDRQLAGFGAEQDALQVERHAPGEACEKLVRAQAGEHAAGHVLAAQRREGGQAARVEAVDQRLELRSRQVKQRPGEDRVRLGRDGGQRLGGAVADGDVLELETQLLDGLQGV